MINIDAKLSWILFIINNCKALPSCMEDRFNDKDLSLTPAERKKISALVVDDDENDAEELRQGMINLKYGLCHVAKDHGEGLKVFSERHYTHVVFSARQTNMPPVEFLVKVLRLDPKTVAIPISYDPKVDDVFELLRKGALGFMAMPFTKDGLDEAIIQATKGEGFSETILMAKDRNEAFAAIMSSNLDKMAEAQHHSVEPSSAAKGNSQELDDLKASAQLAQAFAKGGEEALMNRLVDFFVEVGKGPATRLGRLRKRLKNKRGS
ncbi:hypothetical protein OAO01_04065 [Oligoflexia bacterium]|nr:hypothetical protein [Oligoflexia bacterium]